MADLNSAEGTQLLIQNITEKTSLLSNKVVCDLSIR